MCMWGVEQKSKGLTLETLFASWATAMHLSLAAAGDLNVSPRPEEERKDRSCGGDDGEENESWGPADAHCGQLAAKLFL